MKIKHIEIFYNLSIYNLSNLSIFSHTDLCISEKLDIVTHTTVAYKQK